jgi:protein-disulfide isomerase/uncharacterized membrane protein
MARTRIVAALFLCLAGGALCLILLSKHYGVPLLGEAILAACGDDGGCDVVSQSRYATFLGLPLAAWGLFFYGSLLALLAPSAFGPRDESTDSGLSLAFLLVGLAVSIDVVLLGLQFFVIKAFCKFCTATYVVNGLTLAALWPFRQTSRAANFLFTSASRRAFGSWTVATLAVAAAAVTGNAALQSRRALAASSILGVPPLIQAPQKIEKGSLEEQLAQARAEAKEWKDTLDNENKLQSYLTQKAKDDFNHAAVLDLDLSRAPVKGPAKAPIGVVTYSDFMCPFCRDLALALQRFVPGSGDQLKVYYRNFPLELTCNPKIGRTVHQGACDLARGGICALESGRFWEYHDKVFAQTWERASREDVLRIGEAVGLDRAKFGACIDGAAAQGRLAAEVEEGHRIGVQSTPTVLINGRKLASVNVFLLAIEEERKRLKLPPPPATAAPQNK